MYRNSLSTTKRSIFLIGSLIIVPLVLSETVEQVDAIVDLCVDHTVRFLKIENHFTRKTERGRKEPDLFFPQIKSKKFEAYDKEVRQRPFECIYDTLDYVDNDTLSNSGKYQDLVSKCKAGQSQPKCDPDYPYRTFDGTCNNLNNPTWSSSLSCARRLLPPSYEGASGFRKSACDREQDLPSPRQISLYHMTDLPFIAPFTSAIFIYFGQFLAHDLGDSPVTFVEDKHLDCCVNLHKAVHHPQCAPIIIDKNDYFYKRYNVTCFNNIRTAPCDICRADKRVHMNEVTDVIDLSHVYGLSDDEAAKLRRLDGSGKMKVQETEAGDLLPPNEDIPAFRCGKVPNEDNNTQNDSNSNYRKRRDLTDIHTIVKNNFAITGKKYSKTEYCFKAGDRRVNQHTPLMSYHTIFLREHNRIADTLKSLNPTWDEEKLFQETRKINIAQFQVIVYSEFMNHLLGDKLQQQYDLDVKDGPRTTYDPTVDPTLFTEFSTAAYRLHPMIDYKVGLIGVEGQDSSYLRNLYSVSSHLYEGKMDALLDRLGEWHYKLYINRVAADLSNFLYKEREGHYGFDLSAVNIQRGRDNGLPPYVDVLKYYSNEEIDIKDFDDLAPYFDFFSIEKLKALYCDVRDIDLWVGVNTELPLVKQPPIPVIGPTAAKISAEQFRNLRFGDRFFFDNDQNWFTEDQIKELKKASFSRILCDNTDFVFLQPNAMLSPLQFNYPVKCELLPRVDLTKWKE